jgi:hypothetical protein
MGFLDKAKAAAEQAATKAREGVEDVQTKRNLSHAYEELGRTTHQLVESGEIAHDRLMGHVQEIRGLQAQSSGDAPEAAASAPTPSEPPV